MPKKAQPRRAPPAARSRPWRGATADAGAMARCRHAPRPSPCWPGPPTAWPRARRKLFPRKPSCRASRAKTAAAIETTAEAAAEWAVVQARADAAVAGRAARGHLYRDGPARAGLVAAYTNLCHALPRRRHALQMCTEGYARAKDDRARRGLVNYGVAQYSGGARYFRSAIAAWSKASSQDPRMPRRTATTPRPAWPWASCARPPRPRSSTVDPRPQLLALRTATSTC